MLKLALLGALGFAGYKYYEKNIAARQGATAEVPQLSPADEACANDQVAAVPT